MWSFVCVVLAVSISTFLIVKSEASLTRDQIREKYGQENTKFNFGQSCDRVCNGRRMTCYYEFDVRMFDTMSGACRNCTNGKIEDCSLKDCIVGNGVERVMMSINHQLPGPSINVCKNDRVIVDVTNHIDGQGLSMHWHGLFQKDTPWMDGVPMVTQCPIPFGTTFRYDFPVPQSGTLFYHAHSGVHRTNGVTGALIIRDVHDPNSDQYDYDLSEHTVFLLDWNNMLAEEKIPGVGSIKGFPDSILINGLGSFYDPMLNEYAFAPMATFYVEKGKRHRFRIVNAISIHCQAEFSIKHHNLTVIAADGFPIEPISVDAVVSTNGERFDVVVDAVNDPNMYETLLTVRMAGACFHFVQRKLQAFARIIFVDNINNYSKKIEDREPMKYRPTYESLNIPMTVLNDHLLGCKDPNAYCIASLKHKPAENSFEENLRHAPAKMIPLRTQLLFSGDSFIRSGSYLKVRDEVMIGTINGISTVSSAVPGLTQDDLDVSYCDVNNLPDHCRETQFCRCPHLIDLELCEVYEFLIQDVRPNVDIMTHPIHFHGYGFQVVDMGTREELAKGETAFTNATHLPVIKDTVAIPSAGFVRIRFRACNPGYWLLHCHFEYHTHTGMRTIIRVGNHTDMVPPPSNFPRCGNFFTPVEDNTGTFVFSSFIEITNTHEYSAGTSIHSNASVLICSIICFGIVQKLWLI